MGNISVKEICEYSCVSQRQMERLFLQNIGMSIKRTAGLIRYQNVWRDVVKQERFDVQDAVYRYGFSDQSNPIC
ncbi:helix-turn-helix domain-containing protein [Blautia pseudococcoides]|uniref:helix-turn-helix domain-containing protein n=1 Tax=Blautia pseudococcoides TaxID=1796616 RepID=UPI00159ABBC4|nr:helix-turn-helix domain-containing protein [Blautia pseudococcoides]QJU13008.1 AraC family transcriptional regulator [Blautia pseudococcoides]